MFRHRRTRSGSKNISEDSTFFLRRWAWRSPNDWEAAMSRRTERHHHLRDEVSRLPRVISRVTSVPFNGNCLGYSRFGNRICCKVAVIFLALYVPVGVMFCSNDCFSADHAVYSLEGVVCSGWFRIHNPKQRKFSTLLTKTGCSHSGFIGVFWWSFMQLYPLHVRLSEFPSQPSQVRPTVRHRARTALIAFKLAMIWSHWICSSASRPPRVKVQFFPF